MMSLEKTWHDWSKAVLAGKSHTLKSLWQHFLSPGTGSDCAADGYQQVEAAFTSPARAYVSEKKLY